MSNNQPDINKLERLRDLSGLTIKDMATSLLGVTRASYYAWLKGTPFREGKKKRILLSMKVLAICLRGGTLPIKHLYGKEKRQATMKAVAEALKKLRQV